MQTKTRVTAEITWQEAVQAVCRIVDESPHLGSEFTLAHAAAFEHVALRIREAHAATNGSATITAKPIGESRKGKA